jgi:histone H3/H4
MANLDDSMAKNIVGTLVLFTENALKSAGFYTKHGKRTFITKEDIKRCLMLEVFLFYCRENLQENIENVIEELYGDDADEADEAAEAADEAADEAAEAGPKKIEDLENSFKNSDCECGICQTLNNIHVKWASWQPETPLQEIIQKHINNI